MKLLGMIILMWALFLPSFNLEEVLDRYTKNTYTIKSPVNASKTKSVRDIDHLSDYENVILLRLGNEIFIVPQQKIKKVKELRGRTENLDFTIKYNSQQELSITDTENFSLPYETSNWLHVSSLYQDAKVFY